MDENAARHVDPQWVRGVGEGRGGLQTHCGHGTGRATDDRLHDKGRRQVEGFH